MFDELSVVLIKMTIRVGVVGLGFMGSAHVRVYSQLEGCELVGVCDSSPNKKHLAEQYGCKYFESVDDLLKEELDAVSICTPTSIHKEIALKVLEKNKNILVEKPLATNVEDAKYIIMMAKKSGLLAVGYIERFNPVVAKLKETMDSEDIYSTVSMRFGPGSDRIRDVGVLLDLGSHEIDVLNYITKSEPEVLYAYLSNNSESKFENYAYLSLKFGHLHSHIETSWLPSYKLRCINLYGNKRFYSVNFAQQSIRSFRAPPKVEVKFGNWEDILWLSRNVSEDISVSPTEPLELELKCFVESVRKGEVLEPLCGGQEGLDVLRIIEKAKEKF
jgi:UDP-N-acetylglucosamine 3-dehydrogenase